MLHMETCEATELGRPECNDEFDLRLSRCRFCCGTCRSRVRSGAAVCRTRRRKMLVRCSTLLSHTALVWRPAATCLPVRPRTAASICCGCLKTAGSGSEGRSRLTVRERRSLTSSASSHTRTGWPPEGTMASWLSGTSVNIHWWKMAGRLKATKRELKPEPRHVTKTRNNRKRRPAVLALVQRHMEISGPDSVFSTERR